MTILAPIPKTTPPNIDNSLSTTTPRKVPPASETSSYLEHNISPLIKQAIATELHHKAIFYDGFLRDHFSNVQLDEIRLSIPTLRTPDNSDWLGFPTRCAVEQRKYDPLVHIMNSLSKPSS